MSDIKMSDVFGPKQSPSFGMFMTNEQSKYCYKAFIDYDANQERIAELEGFAVEADSCVDLQRTKINSQQEEIKAFKAQFAAVEYLIAGAYCENSGNNAGMEREWLNMLYRMIDTDNEKQCLADVRADAVDYAHSLIAGCDNGELCCDIVEEYAQQLRNSHES